MPVHYLDIAPRPYVRRTYQGRFDAKAMAYHAYLDSVRIAAKEAKLPELPDAGFRVTFWLQMPKSWSKKRQANVNMTPHQQKPDIDNLLKAFMDALRPEDKAIWAIAGVAKFWGYKAQIEVHVPTWEG